MNKTFVPSFFYAPLIFRPRPTVPKWSPSAFFADLPVPATPPSHCALALKKRPAISCPAQSLLLFQPIHWVTPMAPKWMQFTDIGRNPTPALEKAWRKFERDVMPEVVDPPNRRKPLTAVEVRQAFEPLGQSYPPILQLEQAAQLSGYTAKTLKKKLSEGCFRNCVARGKPLMFWRDRFVLDLMNRPWTPPARREAEHEVGGDDSLPGCLLNGGDNETH
jgi:hypothetical protein